MPFERYLREEDVLPVPLDTSNYYQDNAAVCHQSIPDGVHFQLPQFMLNGPPILAPGGGAEVLPAGLLDSSPDSIGSSWFANNGFAPFHSALISRQIPFFSDGSLDLDHPRPSSSSYRSDLTSSPSPHAFALYSPSGFDVLSILARVVNRPNPTVHLGPVDLSCSFVIVDVRRYDSPIVYASPTFCHLTGYSDQEVLGRNCRFLQSPIGQVAKGEPRRFSSPDAISYMSKLLSSSKECQTTLVNYKKCGQAFVNLVTVIPLRGGVNGAPEEVDDVVYHVGFQVDLTNQPARILDQLRDGAHHSAPDGLWGATNPGFPLVGHGLAHLPHAQTIGPKTGRHSQVMNITASKDLKNLIADTTFTDAVAISTGTNMSGPAGFSTASAEQASTATSSLTMLVAPHNSTTTNRLSTNANSMSPSFPVSLSSSLSLLLLEFLPDFVLVLSLKGAFLYVAPSVRLVLGYESHELVGRGISDICHPADLVPLMRELKEGSVIASSDIGSSAPAGLNLSPRSVDLLFRALPKTPLNSRRDGPVDGVSAGQCSPSTSQSSPSSDSLCSNDLTVGATQPYVWLECRGRLHAEPGKGRKAIILSGRARWMPVVRWSTVDKVSDVSHAGDNHGGSHGSGSIEIAKTPSIHPLDFWALLSPQGTFLVASASIRDVIGWGTSEIIGRNLWTMVRDSRAGLREHVDAELAKLDPPNVKSVVDPPPTILTTSLVHKDLHVVPIRLVFHRTPRSHKHAPPTTSQLRPASNPLIHPLNNPLCPIVCQVTMLCHSEYLPQRNVPTSSGHAANQMQKRMGARGGGTAEPSSSTRSPRTSLFEELEATRGTSWQYELQQLKFANQRLHEELQALEGARANNETAARGTGHTANIPLVPQRPTLSATDTLVTQEPEFHYIPRVHSTSTVRLPNILHERDPPSSEWSSLTGANGQGLNPLKRSWHSNDRPTN